MDYMRPDIVALLRGSDSSYVRQLIGMDPVAVFRWAVLRAAIRAMAVLREAGRLRAESHGDQNYKKNCPETSLRLCLGSRRPEMSDPRRKIQAPKRSVGGFGPPPPPGTSTGLQRPHLSRPQHEII